MTFVAGSLAGKPVRRVEDGDLLRGLGTYVDNLKVDDMVFLAFVRSPAAHAALRSVDVSEAQQMPGVVAVYTADDLELPDYIGFLQVHPGVQHPPLAVGRVYFVGDPVAVVVAESKAQAVDAAELVAVEYEPLPVAIDMELALATGAPLQYEQVPGNLRLGDPGRRRRRRAWRRRDRRPRALREPAGCGRAHGGIRDRRRTRRGGFGLPDHRLCGLPDAAPDEGPDRDGLRPASIPGPGDRSPRRGRVRRQAPHRRGTRRGQGGARARSSGEMGRDALGEPGRHAARAGPGAVRRAWPEPRRQHRRDALPDRRRLRSLRRLRRDAAGDDDEDHGLGLLPHPEDRLRRRGGHHQHHVDGRLPRRRTARSSRVPRADHGHGGRRARDGSGRAAPAQPRPARRLPLHDRDGGGVRQWRLRRRTHRGTPSRRLRRTARRAGRASPTRRPASARDRHVCLRRGHRRRRRGIRLGRGARRRYGDGQGGDLRARPGPRDRLLR